MSRTGVAVVGCGGLACNVHLHTLRRHAGADVLAVADPDPAARERARERAPGARGVATLEEALAVDGVEAVVVATPTALHADQARAVLEGGRHLYVEKPLATRVEDARALVELGAHTEVVAAVGFNRRLHPLVAAMREVVADGALGRVLAVHGTFAEPTGGTGWRVAGEGAGPLLDLASHQADVLRFLLADEAVWVDAAPPDRATATFRIGFAGGAVASLVASFAGVREDTLSLHGERGLLQLDRYARRLTLAATGANWTVRRRQVRPRATLGSRARRIVRPAHDPSYAATLDAWVAAVGGAPFDAPTLEDGL